MLTIFYIHLIQICRQCCMRYRFLAAAPTGSALFHLHLSLLHSPHLFVSASSTQSSDYTSIPLAKTL